MQFFHSRRLLCVCVAIVAAAGCRSDVDDDSLGPLFRLSPVVVTHADGWKLFDRSLSSGYMPTGEPVHVELAGDQRLAAIKVRGGSPYRMTVRGPGGRSLGFASTDLSTLAEGWHVVTPSAAPTVRVLDIVLTPIGSTKGTVPELELWSADSGSESVTADARESSQTLAPGACATFHVELTRAPAVFRRAYLIYDGTGVARSFALSRALNASAAVGGAWMRGATTLRDVREEIDPEELVRGENVVRLCSPASATDKVVVSKLRVVGELDTGRYAFAQPTVDQQEGRNEVALRFDRLIAPDAIAM